MKNEMILAAVVWFGSIAMRGAPVVHAASATAAEPAPNAAPAPNAESGAETQRATDPFRFGTLTGWRSERIPFPLDFAPSLPYTGFEELRFAPGMFDPKSDTYFTYVFFWWIAGDVAPTRERLEKELVVYFKGLGDSVGAARNLKIDTSTVTARAQQVMAFGKAKAAAADTSPRYRAVVQAPDPFNGGAMVTLNIEITSQYCASAKHSCVFFCVSPQPYERDEWDTLWTIRNLFQCAEP